MLLPDSQVSAAAHREVLDVSYRADDIYSRRTDDYVARLDKNVFRDGLLKLQAKIDERFYVTTLAFVHDLCEVINAGIHTQPQSQPAADSKAQPVAPALAKSDFPDLKDRKRLGKRILKSLQPQLEAAARLEADATHKPFNDMKQELEGMMEASIERPWNVNAQGEAEPSRDVIMVDSSNSGITDSAAAGGKAEHARDGPEDTEMVDGNPDQVDGEGNIEVNTSNFDGGPRINGVHPSGASTAEREQYPAAPSKAAPPVNDARPADTPPATNGYTLSVPTLQTGPPTPPHSNGSLGKQPPDGLSDGGVVWYLKGFEPDGTTAVQEHWSGRDAVRSLSEELTEIDEDEIKGLAVDFSENSITANPPHAADKAAETAPAGPAKKNTKSKRRKASYRRR